jgi:hypothetical protein
MNIKPDYVGFARHQMDRDKLGIPVSLNDLIQLAFQYHLPIPRNIIDAGRVRRDDLVIKLIDCWRKAENYYLETGLDTKKEKVRKIQNRLHLNCHEIKLLEEQCNSLGI